jgi:hypothetical protein
MERVDMAQKSQFLVTKGSASINVQPDDLATYLAAGWAIVGIKYSEGGEGVDITSEVLMTKGPVSIYVRPGSVADYIAAGYAAVGILYGASAVPFSDTSGAITFLDTPALVSAEVGTVAATKVVVVFSTEVDAEDFSDGVTITVDDVEKTIASATLQSDGITVHYVIPEVSNGETVLFLYDEDSGNIVSAVDGSTLDSIDEEEVTNNVPGE